MTLPGSTTFRTLADSRRSREEDRTAWAAYRKEVYAITTTGSGQGWLEAFIFKTAFEGEPRFSYGAVARGQGIEAPLYVNAGVADWQIHSAGEGKQEYYIAAYVWLAVDGQERDLDWTFTFSGIALRNRTAIPQGTTSIPPPVPQPPQPPPEPPPPAPPVAFSRNHHADSNVLRRVYPPFTTDAVLRLTLTESHVGDVFLVSRSDVSHSTDLLVLNTRFHHTDSILQATELLASTTDARLQLDTVYAEIYEETY